MSSGLPADNTAQGTNQNATNDPPNLSIPSGSIPPLPFPSLQETPPTKTPNVGTVAQTFTQPTLGNEALIKNISTQIAMMLSTLLKDNVGTPNPEPPSVTPPIASQKETRKEAVGESSTSIPALSEDALTKKIEQVIQKSRMGAKEEDERVLEAVTPFTGKIIQTEIPAKFKLPQLE